MAVAETTAIGRNVVKAERTRAVSQRPCLLQTKGSAVVINKQPQPHKERHEVKKRQPGL